MFSTKTYQKCLLALLLSILFSNLWTILDNRHQRRTTDDTLDKVLQLLEVPPSQVYQSVQGVKETLEQIKQEHSRQSGPRRVHYKHRSPTHTRRDPRDRRRRGQ